MRLLSLKINEPFRSLQAGFELHFLRDWDRTKEFEPKQHEAAPYILAGPNGSGKSNVLEVLAAIFYHLECQYLDYQPDTFAYDEDDNEYGFLEERGIPNAFEMEYLIPTADEYQLVGAPRIAHIRVIKQQGSGAKMYWLNQPSFGADKPLPRLQSKELLPDFVLAYSSGENETLSLPFFKMRFIQFDEYLDSLRKQTPYTGTPESRHIYLDTEFNQAILLCNFLFEDEAMLEPFKKEVGIEGLKQFRIIIRQDEIIDYHEDIINTLSSNDRENDSKTKAELTTLLQGKEGMVYDKEVKEIGLIEKLKRCATCHYYDDETESLYLDYWVTDATKAAFKNHFASSIELFQSLQVLLTLNLYSVSEAQKKELYQSDSLYFNETVPTLPSDKRVMRFKDLVFKKQDTGATIYAKSLSDGEHQFLHSLGLCLLYRNTNSLFLLDEPETHFNPDWRSKFITRLRDCFTQADENAQREMLITTHTPFLISDSKSEQVLEFKKKDRIVSVKRPEYNTLGASINKITIETFNKSDSIGGYAKQKLEKIRSMPQSTVEEINKVKEASRELGESPEKIMLFRELLLREKEFLTND